MKRSVSRLLGLSALLAVLPALAAAQDEIPSLKESLSGKFLIGAAVPTNFVSAVDRHSGLLKRHFNLVVAEDAMKPQALQPIEGRFRFAPADKIVDFAQANGMKVRGHTLLWHQQTSPWFFLDSADRSKEASPELLLSRLEKHVKGILEHYKGRVQAWDVVNEVITDEGKLRDGANGSRWHAILGPGYIDKAFIFAREADPSAVLVINDYNLETLPAKRDAMYDLVKGMLSRGVPVDAVGMQMHVSIYGPSVGEVRTAIEKFASLGLKVQITELDVSIYQGTEAEKPVTPEILELQARRYAELFALFEEEAKLGRVDMVALWGLSDESSWLNAFPVSGRANAPLLFDRDLNPKPAFHAIVAGANNTGH